MQNQNLWSQTRLTRLLGIDYPIIQGPFGSGHSSIELLATVSNAGGLGSFGAHYMKPTEIETLVKDIRLKTSKPFAINLWVSQFDPGALEMSREKFEVYRDRLKSEYQKYQVPTPEFPEKFAEEFEDQVEAVLKAKPPVFSFIFGIPSKEVLQACKKTGIRTLGTATSLEEALALEEAGVDAIVASGFEAGGHRASFLREAEQSLMGTMSLIPMIADRVKIPVVAAGGIADGRGIAAALTLGASAVQVGTAFLACDESDAHPLHKRALHSKNGRPTALTRAFTGRLARGLENQFMRKYGEDRNLIAPYPVQAWLVQKIRAAALAQGDAENISLWAGQSYSQVKHTKAADLFRSLVEETNLILK